MRKKIVIIASVMFMVTILTLAQAGVLENMFNSIKEQISPENKQILKDAIGNSTLPKLNVSYSFTSDEVKWGAYIPNVINTQDNIHQRYWMNCTVMNETTGSCETEVRVDYSKQESADIIADIIAERLNDYAESIKSETNFSAIEIEEVDLN
ncbi:hypothetical protein LCGC14_1304880 [marine sediment metagenome]|uniref:Uncharacterized protein n=1 Tax=marine sediment metagenome TaxID=412755 RepID=A0A0F9KPN2_9ZZZZ